MLVMFSLIQIKSGQLQRAKLLIAEYEVSFDQDVFVLDHLNCPDVTCDPPAPDVCYCDYTGGSGFLLPFLGI